MRFVVVLSAFAMGVIVLLLRSAGFHLAVSLVDYVSGKTAWGRG